MSQIDHKTQSKEVVASCAPQDQQAQCFGGSPAIISIFSGEFWTPQQLAEGLNVSMRTLLRWNQMRAGPARTCIGGVRLYRKATVDAWLKAREEPEVKRKRRA